MTILDVSKLSIRIDTEHGPVHPVVDVSFAVAAGEVLALVGESGSGKSMTATAVLGLLPKRAKVSGGILRFRGADITVQSDEARRTLRGRGMAMVFQDPMQYLNPVMTCGDQVTEALRVLEGCASSEARARALDLFREVGLPSPEKHLHQYPHELSGGMRQRVLIAMMLALEPSLLIADEPTTALDATVQAQILTLLRALAHKRGMALLLITHDLNAVARTADRAAVMQAGRIVETIAVADLFTGAQHPYTQMLVAAMPNRSGGISDGGVHVGTNDHLLLHRPIPQAPVALLTARDLIVAYPSSTGLFGAGRLGEPVVKGVSLEVHAGETLAIVGESGSGKSTLGRALIRLGPVTSGRLIWEDGTDLLSLEGADLRGFRRRAQMVFQDPFASLNPRLSAGYQLAEPLHIHGIHPAGGVPARVAELLESVGLKADDARKFPHQFSGGQRQRLAIARALAVSPQLIVADEPVSSLDMSVQGQVIDLLQELGERLGLTYVFISHDLSVVERIAHRVLVMHKGVIVEEGVTREVFAAPKHEYTRALLDASFSTARF
jgi:ABC-type glutathione transport system ATPase component